MNHLTTPLRFETNEQLGIILANGEPCYEPPNPFNWPRCTSGARLRSEVDAVDLTDLPEEVIRQLSRPYQVAAGLIPEPAPRKPPVERGSMKAFRAQLSTGPVEPELGQSIGPQRVATLFREYFKNIFHSLESAANYHGVSRARLSQIQGGLCPPSKKFLALLGLECVGDGMYRRISA